MKKTILHVVWSGEIGGAEVLLLNVLKFLTSRASGYSYELCVLSDKGPLMVDFHQLGVPVTVFQFQHGTDWRQYIGWARFVKERQFDLIHLHSVMYPAPAIKLAGKTPVVRTDHGGRLMNEKGLRLRRTQLAAMLLNPFIDKHIAISEPVRTQLKTKYRVPDRKITVIHNGIRADQPMHVSRREQFGLSSEHFVIGTVCRLIPEKGVQHLLEAAKLAVQADDTLRFVIVGDGPYRSHLEHLCDEFKLREYVHFLGSRKDAYELYAMLDLFCMTSVWAEPFGMTMLEAMSQGVPVIAFDSGAVKEIIQHGSSGWIIPPDSAALSDAILQARSDRPQLHNAAKQAMSRLQSYFSMDAMCGKLTSVYHELIGE
jgi:L-malate glycosyltransferase